jgi:hypothetical protein
MAVARMGEKLGVAVVASPRAYSLGFRVRGIVDEHIEIPSGVVGIRAGLVLVVASTEEATAAWRALAAGPSPPLQASRFRRTTDLSLLAASAKDVAALVDDAGLRARIDTSPWIVSCVGCHAPEILGGLAALGVRITR